MRTATMMIPANTFYLQHYYHPVSSSPDINYLVIFGIGIIFQSIAMLASVSDRKSTFYATMKSALWALIAVMPGKHETVYQPIQHYFFYLIVYAVLFSYWNGKKILPTINERSLLVFNTLFLYYYFLFCLPAFSAWGWSHGTMRILTALIALPTLLVLINALIPTPAKNSLKTLFYVWYLTMAGIMLVIVCAPQAYKVINYGDYLPLPLLTMFTLGMVTFCFFVDLTNILLLVPWPAKHQRFSDRIANVKAHIAMLNSKYLDSTINPLDSVLLVVFVAGALLCNYLYLHFNELLVINLAILSQRFLFGNRILRKQAAADKSV